MLPVIFTLQGLGWEIQSYGLMLALALLLGWVVVQALGRRDRLPPGPLGTAYVLGAGAGLAAARVAWLLQRPGDSAAGAELFALRGDELAPFAGMFAAGLVAGLHLMRRRVPVVAGYDVAAPAFAAGAIVERLGSLLAGTGYGAHAPDLPWGIRFPMGSPAFVDHQRALGPLMSTGAEQSLPVHPTQLYGMVLAGITLAVALMLRKRRKFSGQVFLGTAITYLLGRALVEDWFRADAAAGLLGPFNSGQVGALVLAAALGVVLWSRNKLATHRPQAFRTWEGGRWSPQGGDAHGGSSAAASTSSGDPGASAVARPSRSRGRNKGKGRKGRAKGKGPGRRRKKR